MSAEKLETQLLERTRLNINNEGESCEDCPDINVDPPSRSECPFFGERNGVPVCERPGSMQKQLDKFIGGGDIGIGNTACEAIVQVANDLQT